MASATGFPDLNALVGDLVTQVQASLGPTFCGAYLQGSFALGDADRYSDVDFIVALHDDLTEDQQAALTALHGEIFGRKVEWAQHLEGSYLPTPLLRSVDPARTPLFYLDNGAKTPIWDAHCNTAVVRWTLREHGIILAGPHPRDLIDPVPADALVEEAVFKARDHEVWAEESFRIYQGGEGLAFSRWKQPYLVVSACRFLHTATTGTVVTKREAGEWAISALGAEWRDLVSRALANRPDPWERVHRAADAQSAQETLDFVRFVAGEIGRASSG